ncbi:3-isopropylmalate dehydratase small subunit [Parasphingorhabdus sp. DH2-15]|uniref:3-isopropylmalate dehydratase small subunit n=1 Tax=Parasphingorhabdus sp. DH2-15 TaxID=3444112 RepID=UPI003F683E42
MTPFTKLTSKSVILEQVDIDTDQIIPARFLTTTESAGLGDKAFYDWRRDENGALRDNHVLNHVNTATHQILVAGPNFGCGSSREHAPWALLDFGFRVVISSDIADIFTSNALKNGLLPVQVPADIHAQLLAKPGLSITVDLENEQLSAQDISCHFTIERFARQCLLDGVDPLGALLAQREAISRFEIAQNQS